MTYSMSYSCAKQHWLKTHQNLLSSISTRYSTAVFAYLNTEQKQEVEEYLADKKYLPPVDLIL